MRPHSLRQFVPKKPPLKKQNKIICSPNKKKQNTFFGIVPWITPIYIPYTLWIILLFLLLYYIIFIFVCVVRFGCFLASTPSIQPHWAIRWSKYGPPMYPGSRYIHTFSRTNKKNIEQPPRMGQDGTVNDLGTRLQSCPIFFSLLLLSYVHREETLVFFFPIVSLFFFWGSPTSIQRRPSSLFFFTFVPGTHMDPDVEQKIQRGNRHCVTNPIRSNKKISTIFYRRNLKIVDETLVGRLTKRKRRKKRNAIIPLRQFRRGMSYNVELSCHYKETRRHILVQFPPFTGKMWEMGQLGTINTIQSDH